MNRILKPNELTEGLMLTKDMIETEVTRRTKDKVTVWGHFAKSANKEVPYKGNPNEETNMASNLAKQDIIDFFYAEVRVEIEKLKYDITGLLRLLARDERTEKRIEKRFDKILETMS